MARPRHFIFLVPGFFGFANLGDLKYFAHVSGVLRAALERQGIAAEVINVKTWPTSSVRRRAHRLLEQMVEVAGDGSEPIHLVGHSSGGLDCRLLVSAGASLATELPAEAMVQRVRSVTAVATPHYGTPLASFFMTVPGARLLRLLSMSMIYSLRYGRLPISALVQMAGVLIKIDRQMSADDPMDQLYDQLLSDFSAERQREIREFFREVNQDQSLIQQLVPPAMATFNAVTRDVPGVRYGCVVARARSPGVASTVSAGLSAYAQASHALYAGLWAATSRMPIDRLPLPNAQQVQALTASFGEMPEASHSDGFVPTLSQLWGQVIHVAHADHHDLIGHFDDSSHDPPHYDWITCGSGFKRRQFEVLWGHVAEFIAAGHADECADPAVRYA
ncbi:MAG: triacylglycerol lipase [Deltaproteobacteria bacterium]|nr:triacylglycerol lipase [Deltaproteobacteria bacterium]